MNKQGRSSWTIYLPLVLGPLVLFSSLIIDGQALYWGTPSLQFIPWWDWAWETIRSGILPLWNPLAGMGAPLIGNYQSALFYPPNWLYFVMDSLGGVEWMARATVWLVVLHLAWTGTGMALLLRRIGSSRFGQVVGGLTFSLSGYLVARAGFLSITSAAAWIPWILSGVLAIIRHKDWTSIFAAGAGFGIQFLAGHAQTAWYTILLAGAWCIYFTLRENDSHGLREQIHGLIAAAGRLAAAGILGAMLAAVQLLPTLKYLLSSSRADEFGYQAAVTYSFWPWRLLSLVSPDLFGSPVRGTYWGYGNYWEDAVYIGLLPFVLAVTAVISSLRKSSKDQPSQKDKRPKEEGNRSLIWFLVGVILVSFTLALGDNTPVFPFFYRVVPTFDLFQAPSRMTIWAVFSFSILAALGADRIRAPEGRRLYWNRLAVAGSAALAIGAGLTWKLVPGVHLTFIRAGAVLGIWAVGSSVIFLTAPEEKDGSRYRIWQWAAIGLISIDLVFSGWGLNPGVKADFYRTRKDLQGAAERVYIQPEDEYRIKFDVFFQFEEFQPESSLQALRESYLPNLNMLDGVASANNFDPLVSARYQRWMAALEQAGGEVREMMLDQMAVQTLIHPEESGRAKLETRKSGGGQAVRFTSCLRYVEENERVLPFLAETSLADQKLTLIEGESPGAAWSGCTASRYQIDVLEKIPGRLVVEVDADQPGWLIWSQVNYPGWQGRVNGQEEQIRSANYLFQALPVDSGLQVVEFRYRPAGFYWGAAISLTVVLGLMTWRMSASPQPRDPVRRVD